jgi:hypothetical protein
MKKKDLRFSLCLDNNKPIIVIDSGIIMEAIFKFKNGWKCGMKLMLGLPAPKFIASFMEWKKAKFLEIQGQGEYSGEKYILTNDDIIQIKKEIMKRDKRIKLL